MNILVGLRNDVHGHLLWAAWTVDALYYLDDLDQDAERFRWTRLGHHPDSVALAHARWAASTAMTALDLSAAAIGEQHSLASRSTGHAHDIGTLQENQNRAQLCAGCTAWLDAVVSDTDYELLKNARDPLVHRKLPRIVKIGGGSAPTPVDRLGLAVPGAQSPTGEMPSRQLVELSRDTATRHVVALLQAAEAGQI